jgi:hemerythrin superfamily protein
MNLIELLMAEHASLRVYFRHLRYLNSDFLFELDDFVVNCHAKIEDEVIFPEMRKAAGTENKNIETITRRMEEEHKVIQMLGNSIRIAVAEGSKDIDRGKIMLYADTLESHNSSEETLLFPTWRLDSEQEAEAVSKAVQIIRDFGLERYLRVTGLSQEFLSLLR